MYLIAYMVRYVIGSKIQPETQGYPRTTIQRATMGNIFTLMLPLYGVLFTLIFFSVGLNNYYHPDIIQD